LFTTSTSMLVCSVSNRPSIFVLGDLPLNC
jgi:hypothetical protein